jgi:hypothetical protein
MPTNPNRDAVLELQEAPVPVEPKIADSPLSEDAPYGYKKDGTPAKRRGRAPGFKLGPRTSGGRRGGSLETQIGAFLLTVNAPFMLFMPQDALEHVEIEALAHAIDEECQRNDRFRKMVERALAVQGGTSLLLVVAAIAGRRVVRHRLVTVPDPIGNEGADAALGQIIAMTTGKGPNLSVMPDVAATSAT